MWKKALTAALLGLLTSAAVFSAIVAPAFAATTTFSVTCPMDESATQATLAVSISGGTLTSVSPTSAACTGSAVTITVTYTVLSGATVTITEPSDNTYTRYRFAGSATSESNSCSASSCPSFTVTNYEELYQEFNMKPQGSSKWDAAYSESVTGAVSNTISGTFPTVCSVSLSSGGGQSDCQGWVDYSRTFQYPSSWTATGSDAPSPWGITWTSFTASQPAITGNAGTSGNSLFNATYAIGGTTTESISTVAGESHAWYVPSAESLSEVAAGASHYNLVTDGLYGLCANHTVGTVYCGTGYLIKVSSGIKGLDCGDCLIADGKYYNFKALANDTNGQSGNDIVLVEFALTDGANDIIFGYNNITKATTAIQDGAAIALGQATATTKILAKGIQLNVTIPVALTTQVLDSAHVSLLIYVQLADGSTWGFFPVENNLVIINQGGASTTKLTAPSATTVPSQGIYGCSVWASPLYPDSSCDTNSSWYGLNWFSTQFSLYPSYPGYDSVNSTYMWQSPNAPKGSGNTRYTVPGDWKLWLNWYYWDGSRWVDGEKILMSMLQGNQGPDNEWTTIQTVYYDAEGLVSNQSATCWIEQGTSQSGSVTGQVRFFVDMWMDKGNASTLIGGRVGCYYVGMHHSGLLWWGSWSPSVENGSASIAIMPLYNSTGDKISSQTLLCSKIGFNLTRSVNPSYSYPAQSPQDENFAIESDSFSILKFQTTSPQTMGGIATPAFVIAAIPTLPSSGFLSPLWAALGAVAGAIWSVISGALTAAWGGLGSRFPWFTAFWGDVGSGILAFTNLLFLLFVYVIEALQFIARAFSWVLIPIGLITSIYNGIAPGFTWLPVNEVPTFIELIVIFFFGVRYLTVFESGDWGLIIEDTRKVWNVAQSILYWAFWLVKSVIDAFEGLIP